MKFAGFYTPANKTNMAPNMAPVNGSYFFYVLKHTVLCINAKYISNLFERWFEACVLNR